MRKPAFSEWHGFHGFHGIHVHPPHLLVAVLSVLAPFVVLFALSFLVRDVAGGQAPRDQPGITGVWTTSV